MPLKKKKAAQDQIPYEVSFLLAFADGVGTGLQTLRNKGFLHGDFNPWNILVTVNEGAYLLDFERTKKISAELATDKALEDLLYFELLAEMLVTPADLSTVYTFFKLLTGLYSAQGVSLKNIPIWINAPTACDELPTTASELQEKFCQLQAKHDLVPAELKLTEVQLIKIVFLIDVLARAYGDSFAHFFAQNLTNCITDQSWTFTDFSEEFCLELMKAEPVKEHGQLV